MSCGSPVILSNSSSLPEVGGDAVLYVDPFSVGSIKETIERIVYDDELRKSMAKKSLKQSQKFSWERTAEQTEEVYAKVLEL
jgi:glycosyltransferase involved in cell wall biosynthesis